MREQTLTNARIVLADRVVEGSLHIRDGVITDVSEGPVALPGALDLDGDLLMPGLVELHTDNLETHVTPRPRAEWPTTSAAIAHDSQMAVSGITTVLDALALGDVRQGSTRINRLHAMVEGVCQAADAGLLRVEHFLHLRCEVSYPNMPLALEKLIDNPRVRMLSVMDHTPGQRQFVQMEPAYAYYQGKFGLSDADMITFIAQRQAEHAQYSRPHRDLVVATARARSIALASHDDATIEHVDEAVADGITVAEFPTTVAAARASHRAGMRVMMGGPNLVRGGSHSGNVSGLELAM